MKELTLAEATEALKKGKKVRTKDGFVYFHLGKDGKFYYEGKKQTPCEIDFSGLCTCISDFEELLNEKHFILAKEKILDKEEREYLGNIVRPFKKKYKGIRIEKSVTYEKSARILIFVPRKDEDIDVIDLPRFNSDNMYKGMEPKKQYTLEELGL